MNKNWYTATLRDANVGDSIWYNDGRAYDRSRGSIRTIVKATKTKVTDNTGAEWTRKGYRYGLGGGLSYGASSVDLITDLPAAQEYLAEIEAKAKHRAMRDRLANNLWSAVQGGLISQLTDDELQAIDGVITKAQDRIKLLLINKAAAQAVVIEQRGW